MFTGIIHGQGEVTALQSLGKETRLTLHARYALDHIQKGESIAVNGVCLTVESFGERVFTAYASSETMSRTNLGALRVGSLANMERALAVGDRFGGHMVSGHVDCLAKVEGISHAGQSRCIRLSFPAAYASEVVPKGSITLDGVSLTVNSCGSDYLEVNVIPETFRVTTVEHWTKGQGVNMETDIIGKYVRHMLGPYLPGAAARQGSTSAAVHDAAPLSGIDEHFLKQHGFF